MSLRSALSGVTVPAPGVDRRGARSALPARLAGIGLVLVLLALAMFAVTALVAGARAAAQVERSGVISELSEAAQRALLLQAELAGQVVEEPGPMARAEYDAANARAVAALSALAEADQGQDEVGARALALHRSYATEVERLFEVAEHDPAGAEAYEDGSVEPAFEAVERFVQLEADRHWWQAQEALAELGRYQQILLTATPFVVGLGLLLVAGFGVVVRRHRREIAGQARVNRHQARHDSLTGLPNRTLLSEAAEAAVTTAEQLGQHAALLFIDLDRFKEINDTLGHHYGDVVLVAVAERLQRAVRASDVVARLGGDEFAVLLPSVDGLEAATKVALQVHAAVQEPIEADGVRLDIDASVGVVVSGFHGHDVATLLQHADIAMYVAKDRALGVCVYANDLNGHSVERLGLLGELRRALDTGELVLYFQPKVALPTAKVCGVEALLRWNHPERGLVPPDVFVPVAERTALIRPLTLYVVTAALEQCRRWQDEGRNLRVAVNVSARNLLDERFVDDVEALRQRWQVPASCLELEVTESAIMTDPVRAQSAIHRFAALGYTLSIDDFGAGYTSLAHLKNLAVHQLKIDRSFVRQMQAERSDALIVRSVVELGRNLGLTIVAEGVEDEATYEHLAALGCDVAQGYYLSRPLPAEQLDAWFAAASSAAQTAPALTSTSI